MKEFFKKNFALVLAFLLPVALIAFVAISTYFPRTPVKTDYDFVYVSCDRTLNYYSYECGSYARSLYSVVNNRIVKNPIDPAQDSDKDGVADVKENYAVHIFLHDTEKNVSREITFADSQTLAVSGLLTSPDGVTVSKGYNQRAEFFPFYSSQSNYGLYLAKGKERTKLNLLNVEDNYYYQENFRFLGWVLPAVEL